MGCLKGNRKHIAIIIDDCCFKSVIITNFEYKFILFEQHVPNCHFHCVRVINLRFARRGK